MDKMVIISATCQECNKKFSYEVFEKDLNNYNNGMLIQRAFPYLKPGERELFISGFCGKCFDKLMGI